LLRTDDIVRLVRLRDEARARGDYAQADELRRELMAELDGMYRLALLDEPDGTTFWYWTAT
jgi:cysteinyl-tRNA synthetase